MKWWWIGLLLLSSFVSRSQTIATFAGGGTVLGDGGPATEAITISPCGGSFDKYGNYYFTESTGQRVRKVSTAGIITTVAGGGSGGLGDSGLATSATLSSPANVILDTFGNLYIADVNNERIREVDITTGIITTICGNGTGAYYGDGGLATTAEIWGPQDICFDKFGNLYIADAFNYRVRKINTSGIISTFAGSGGYSATGTGDGGLATAATFNLVTGLTADDTGNIYIADYNAGKVRKVDTTGIITTIAGNGTPTYIGDGMPATDAQIAPVRIGFDSLENLFIADEYNFRVYKVDLAGILYNIAGNGVAGFSGDGDPADSAEFDYPAGISFDHCGNLYIPDIGNKRIRKVIFDSIPITPTPTVNISASPSDTICSGMLVTFNATFTGGGASSFYQWYVNGHLISDTIGNSYTYVPTNGDFVSCILYTGNICATPANASSNVVHMVVDTAITPSINITASTGDTICIGTSVTFTATTTGAGSTPGYQWVVNGSYVGTGGSTYTYTPANGDSIRCILTGSNPCATASTISSNSLIMSVGASESPGIFITVTPRDSVCMGTPATFTASISLGGASPAYRWKVNGANVGISSNTYSYTPANGDSIRCLLTSSASCAVPAIISSNTIDMVVDTFIVPAISITSNATAAIGSIVTVNATVSGAGSSYTIHWYDNGVLFNTTTVPVVTYTKGAGTDVIMATVIPALAGCYDSTTSAAFTIMVSDVGVASPRPSPGERVLVYPNPAGNNVTIEGAQGCEVSIFNMVGQRILEDKVANNKQTENIASLIDGVYIVRVINSDGEEKNIRLLKE